MPITHTQDRISRLVFIIHFLTKTTFNNRPNNSSRETMVSSSGATGSVAAPAITTTVTSSCCAVPVVYLDQRQVIVKANPVGALQQPPLQVGKNELGCGIVHFPQQLQQSIRT